MSNLTKARQSANQEKTTNGFLNRQFEIVIRDGYPLSDGLRAASFVAPWIDFSALTPALRNEAQMLILTMRRTEYSETFIELCADRGWKSEKGIYYPLTKGRYYLTENIVSRVTMEQIEIPWLNTHSQSDLYGLMCFIDKLNRENTLNGLIATALANDYKPEPELQLPWQESKSTIDRFGDAAVHTGGALVGALLRSFGL